MEFARKCREKKRLYPSLEGRDHTIIVCGSPRLPTTTVSGYLFLGSPSWKHTLPLYTSYAVFRDVMNAFSLAKDYGRESIQKKITPKSCRWWSRASVRLLVYSSLTGPRGGSQYPAVKRYTRTQCICGCTVTMLCFSAKTTKKAESEQDIWSTHVARGPRNIIREAYSIVRSYWNGFVNSKDSTPNYQSTSSPIYYWQQSSHRWSGTYAQSTLATSHSVYTGKHGSSEPRSFAICWSFKKYWYWQQSSFWNNYDLSLTTSIGRVV